MVFPIFGFDAFNSSTSVAESLFPVRAIADAGNSENEQTSPWKCVFHIVNILECGHGLNSFFSASFLLWSIVPSVNRRDSFGKDGNIREKHEVVLGSVWESCRVEFSSSDGDSLTHSRILFAWRSLSDPLVTRSRILFA